MHNVEHGHHVTTAPTILERRQVQLPQPLLVRQRPELRNETRRSPLDALHQLSVSLVKGPPHLITIFKVWADHRLVQQRQGCRIQVGKAVTKESQDPVCLSNRNSSLHLEFELLVDPGTQVFLHIHILQLFSLDGVVSLAIPAA